MSDATDSAQPIRVLGRYALCAEMAAGGMATVHFGRLLGPVGFSRTVAIKRLHPHYAKDPEFVSMFLDEARLAARIQHPNVVQTLDVVATGGELFLVMEYVAGESLSKLLRAARRRKEPIAPSVVCAIMSGVLHGLHAAHEAKTERGEPLRLVHRDVSPQNILIGTDGIARVLDFGIAKATLRVQSTDGGQVKGKVSYMAPEQLAANPLDRRADLFAAGVVIWEMLTGKRLFEGDDLPAIFSKVMSAHIPEPSSVLGSLPKALDAVVLRALCRDPDGRFQTAREFAIALEQASILATPRQVGEWVEALVDDALTKRARQVAEIESFSATSPQALESTVPTLSATFRPLTSADSVSTASGLSQPSPTSTSPSVDASDFRPARGRRLVFVTTAAAAAVLAVTAGVHLLDAPTEQFRGVSGPPAPADIWAAASVKTTDRAASKSGSPGENAAAIDAAERAFAAKDASGSTPEPATAPMRAQASFAPEKSGPKTATTAARAHGESAAGCDPPYRVDARGVRRPKLECL